MDKKTFVERMAITAHMTQKAAHEALDAFHETLVTGLNEDGEVVLNGIGKFSVGVSPARQGRNPATGEMIDIPEKNKVKFKAAKALKDATGA